MGDKKKYTSQTEKEWSVKVKEKPGRVVSWKKNLKVVEKEINTNRGVDRRLWMDVQIFHSWREGRRNDHRSWQWVMWLGVWEISLLSLSIFSLK